MKKIAFLFPGQGSQYIGMGKDLYDKYESVRKYFEAASDIMGFDLATTIFESSEEELKQTLVTQSSIYLISASLYSVFSENSGIKPDFTAGHSLGEYSAYFAAGVFDFESGMRLVKARGEAIMQASNANPGSMAALIGGGSDAVVKLCEEARKTGLLEAVNFNSAEQIVVAGSKEAVAYAVANAKNFGIKKAVELKVSGAFHSSLMAAAFNKFKPALENTRFNDPTVPVVTNCSGVARTDSGAIKADAALQIKSPVLWDKSINYMKDYGVGMFYEIGPGKVLSGLNKRIYPESSTINIDSDSKIAELAINGGVR